MHYPQAKALTYFLFNHDSLLLDNHADSTAASPSPSSIASNDFLGMADLIMQLPDAPSPPHSLPKNHAMELDASPFHSMQYGPLDFDFPASPTYSAAPGASPGVDAAPSQTENDGTVPPARRPGRDGDGDGDGAGDHPDGAGPGGPPPPGPPSGPGPAGPRGGRVGKRSRRRRRYRPYPGKNVSHPQGTIYVAIQWNLR